LLAGCSGGEDSAMSSDAGAASAPELAQGLSDSAGPRPGPAGGVDRTRWRGSTPVGSAVIRTAELDVQVDGVRAAADAAGRLARDAGGGVELERAGAGDLASAELRLRVPPERFDEVLTQLSELGEERSRTLSTEEVGDQLVDLDSRLATQRASVERVRALLAEAGDLGEVVQIEAELTRRTADLESLQARRAALGEQVALSTVVLRLQGDDGDDVVAGAPGFLDGLRGGWEALAATALVLATVTGALVPFVPFVLLAVWLTVRLRRRRPAAAPVPSG
jgi:hypothetical protein